ncbi:AraC-type DNA-binding protein [Chitinophaga rupis]|uniref:AraC-type DNA-binding protein n=1 Tax=Chitinophaga rupis TaxID=573321 RepID=A0A1H7ZFC8_9BACT|nr:helix-turn-helix transcriptional regulator [Chitinophaga rupis]SEM56694.1 AraC-type DNA-binding protein [Chitinophaga rupis]
MKPKAPTKDQLEQYALRGLGYADDHVMESFNMKEVSDWLGISYSYFYHIFAEIMGEPYWQYVKRHRLELAAGLLRHSGYNIGEISDLSGYATMAAFTKAFTNHFGGSPRYFRRIEELPNEKRTLEMTAMITAVHAQQGSTIGNFFSFERAEHVILPDSIMYYTLISYGQDPIAQLVMRMSRYEQRFRKMLDLLDLPQGKIVTGTLDAVPVTDYERLSMYAGVCIPVKDTQANIQLSEQVKNLIRKRISGGHYLRLQVPLDFVSAGVPMYDFINRCCREGIYKMSGNHFFMSLTGPNLCEIYIPYMKNI